MPKAEKKRAPLGSAELRKHRAYHEAAHAVVAHLLNIPSVVNRSAEELVATISDSGGEVPIVRDQDNPNAPRPPAEVRNIQLALCAGMAAEKVFLGRIGAAHHNDRQEIDRLGQELRKGGYLSDSRDVLIAETKAILKNDRNKRIVEACAEVLLEDDRLTAGQLRSIADSQG